MLGRSRCFIISVVRSSPSLGRYGGIPNDNFLLEPNAEYDGCQECLHQCVPGVDGIECPGHVLMKDGAHQKHCLKPNPDPESELQRTLLVAETSGYALRFVRKKPGYAESL